VRTLTKYWYVLGIGVQNNLTYRFNFLARTLFGFIPLTAILLLWRNIYGGKGDGAEVAAYTLAQMTTYYLVATVVDALTAVNEDDWQIAADIKDGNISQFLLKPVDYLWFRFCLFLSGRATYLTVAILPIAGVILLLRDQFLLPADGTVIAWFLLSVLLTALLQFFLSYAMAMLAFWLMEISTLVFILYAFEYIASGHMFPLDVLPESLRSFLLNFTPFPYQLYLPVGIYLGKVQGPALVNGLVLQAGWVLAAYGLARLAWYRGIRKYAAAGG
jgi:ABC-2 type transport system permease protein